MPEPLGLLRGTLDVLVLKALAWTPMHGFEITTWLERQSGGALQAEDSALYQALYRMEARGLVTAEWGTTDKNRRARYYRATSAGLAYLKAETERWLAYSSAVTGVLTGPAPAR